MVVCWTSYEQLKTNYTGAIHHILTWQYTMFYHEHTSHTHLAVYNVLPWAYIISRTYRWC